MPVYKVTMKGSKTKPRLIKAPNSARARDHALGVHNIELAPVTVDELAELVGDGAEIEKAGEEPKPAETENGNEANPAP